MNCSIKKLDVITEVEQPFMIGGSSCNKIVRDAQDRLLWRNKTCPVRT